MRTKRKFIIFVSLFFLMINLLLSYSVKDEYSKYWFKFYSLASKNRKSEAIKVIEQFFKEKYQYNKQKEILTLIWNYSLEKIKEGDKEAGKDYLYTLVKYDKNWKIYDDLAYIELKSFNFTKGIRNSVKTLLLFLKSNDNILILTPLAKAFFLGIFISFLIFVFFKYFYYFEVLVFDLNVSSKLLKSIIFIIFLFLPSIFFLGLFYIPFGLAAIAFFYSLKEEKKTIFIYLIIFLLSFVFLLYTNIIQTASQNENYRAILKIKNGEYKTNYLTKIENSLGNNPDPQLALTLAVRYYNDNLLFDAKRVLERIKETEQYNKIKYFYLGNIYYKVGFFSKAKDMYFKALQSAPDDPYINFNISVLLYRINQPDLAQKYALISQKAGIRRSEDIISLKDPIDINVFSYVKFKIERKDFNHPILIGLIVFFVLLALLKLIIRNIGSSTRCASCGRPTKKNRNSVNDRYCEECFNLFIIREPFLSETRKIKYKEIEENNLKKSKIVLFLSIFFPGLDFIYREKIYLYFILSSVFYFFFALFFFVRLDLIPLKFDSLISFPEIFLWIALFFYLVINFIIYFLEKKEWL